MSERLHNEHLGWVSFGAGASAFLLVMVVFWAGPFAPQQSAGATLGELAAEIARSAARSASGKQAPVPMASARTIDDHLAVGVAIMSGLAIILGLASFIRREGKRAAMAGIALGGAAIGFQLFTWAIVMIVGALTIGSLLYAMRDNFGDLFSG